MIHGMSNLLLELALRYKHACMDSHLVRKYFTESITLFSSLHLNYKGPLMCEVMHLYSYSAYSVIFNRTLNGYS